MKQISRDNMTKHHYDANKLFSGKILREISKSGYSPTLKKNAKNLKDLDLDLNLIELTREVFSRLKKEYRSDYVYRVAITKKIFLGRHSPNSTVLIPELRAGMSRADLVMVNGTTTVFEIKSDIDSIERLGNQVKDYLTSFDLIYLVTSKQLAEKAYNILPESVGIISLSERYTLQKIRKAKSNAKNIDINVASSLLRTNELKDITKELTGKTPSSPNIKIRRDCLESLNYTSPKSFHKQMTKALKNRVHYKKDNFEELPEWLIPAFIESGIKPSDWNKLSVQLNKNSTKSFMEEPCQYISHT